MSIKATEQPTFPFLFAARDFNADAASEKRVLYHLISRLQNGTCFPSQKKMAYEEQVTEKSVKRAIHSLKAKGVITVERHGKNNVYRLHLDAIKKHQLPPMPDEPERPRKETGVSVGKKEQGTPMSPIDNRAQGTPMSPIPAIGDICDHDRGHHDPRKKTEKKTSKEKKTENTYSQQSGEPAQPGAEEVSVSEDQGTQGRVNPIPPHGMPTKPQITLERAQKILNVYADLADLNDAVICADCTSIGKIADGRCTFCDADGSVCGGTRLVNKLEWMNLIRDQWDKYNKQILDVAGVPLKDAVGMLRLDSMEQQEEIKKCRRAATVMSMGKRRHWAKQMFDTGNYYKVRKAWFLYASGMLDDDAGEPEPWVTQLFADLEALKSRDGESK